MEAPHPPSQIIPPCRRRRTTHANSPEFEFWMVRNPSFPQPDPLSADELFSDGFLLPLHLIRLSDDHPHPKERIQVPAPDRTFDLHRESALELPRSSSSVRNFGNSKRWRQIFEKPNKKLLESASAGGGDQSKEARVKENKREKKTGGAGNMVSAVELNINLWPFPRSRSAGNNAARPRTTAASRKSSSAPCSRSNSGGESKARKWSNSPNRAAGVHLGRSSPVWQVRRAGVAAVKSSSKKDAPDGRRKIPVTRALSLNVPMCIGYPQQISCRNDENSLLSAAAADGGGGEGSVSGGGVRRSNLFNIRNLFTKKVY